MLKPPGPKHVVVFGDRAFKEVTKLKGEGSLGWALIQEDWRLEHRHTEDNPGT
jgi:hypothetical protein